MRKYIPSVFQEGERDATESVLKKTRKTTPARITGRYLRTGT